MSGITLTTDVLTGLKRGIADSASSINISISNAILWELALATVGLALAIGVILYFLKGHKKIGGGGHYFSEGYPGLSNKQRSEWNRLDDYGMKR